jgi:hypothetical protein
MANPSNSNSAVLSFESLEEKAKRKLINAFSERDKINAEIKAVKDHHKANSEKVANELKNLKAFMIERKIGRLVDMPFNYNVTLEETVTTVAKSTPFNKELVLEVCGELFRHLNIPLDPKYVWELLRARRSQLFQQARANAIQKREYKLNVKKDKAEIPYEMDQARRMQGEILQQARAEMIHLASSGGQIVNGTPRQATKDSSSMM